jgi:hypothetical protein
MMRGGGAASGVWVVCVGKLFQVKNFLT